MPAETPFPTEGRTTVDRSRDRARDRSDDLQGRAREQASRAADRARDKAEEGISQQKQNATSRLDSVTSALHTTSDTLRDEHQDSIASMVDSAADQVERLSSYVRERTVGELFDDIQDVARREPALFLGGAAMLGIIGARFLKSSQSQRYDRGDYYRDYDDEPDYRRRARYRQSDFGDRDRVAPSRGDLDYDSAPDEVW